MYALAESWDDDIEKIKSYLQLKKQPFSSNKISKETVIRKTRVSAFLHKSQDVIRLDPIEVGSGKNNLSIWKWAPGMGESTCKKTYFNPDKPRMNITVE